MRYRNLTWGSISLVLILALMVSGCGGGGSMPSGAGTPDPTPTVDFHGNGGLELDWASFGPSVPATGVNEAAPLGTDPQYNMTLITPDTEQKLVSSRTTAGVLEGDPLDVLGVAITPADHTDVNTISWITDNNANNSGKSFEEGSNVKLWVKFETSGSMSFIRKWIVGSPINQTTTEPVAGVDRKGTYVVSLFQTLPMLEGDADQNSSFAAYMEKLRSTSRAGSVIPVLDDDLPYKETLSLAFTILNFHDNPQPPTCWQMAWEKSLAGNPDYDYNDLVCRLCANEVLTADNKVKQINVRVKAIARGDGYSANWQFNLNSDFPGTKVTSYTQMYQHGGAKDGPMRTWRSDSGVGIPVFTPVRNVIPSPSGPTSTVNVIAGEAYSHGGWVDIKIILDTPISLNNYTPIPYTNQMRIEDTPGEVHLVNLRTGKGTAKDKLNRPLGFLTPAQYPWALEGRELSIAYPNFNSWVTWANSSTSTAASEPKWWLDPPIYTTGSKKNAYRPAYFVGGPSVPVPD